MRADRQPLGAILMTTLCMLACQKEQPSAPPPATAGTVVGRVTDLDTPSSLVVGAIVTIGGRWAVTGSGGDFLIQGVPVGTQTVTSAASGYDPYSDRVDVVAGAPVRKNLSMQRTVHQVVLVPVADAYSNSDSPATNYGSDLNLNTRNMNPVGTADYTAFIQFDVSAIPPDATILGAILTLSPARDRDFLTAAGYTVVYRVAGPAWTESGLTYQNQPSPFPTSVWVRYVTFAEDPSVDFNVEDAVKAWVNLGNPNYGLMLKTSLIPAAPNRAAFYSREAANGNNVFLTVRYFNPL